ncbi:MAG: AI-2E family transporter [Boseongicola sp.]|nr:AI-2E family transporter [Boseongicola sp.]
MAIVLLLAAIVLARNFLMPVFLAFLLALTFSPIRRFLQRRGVAASVTAAGLVFGLFLVLGILILLLYEPVQNYATDSGRIAADVERKLRGISETIEKVADAGEQVEELASAEADPDVEEVVIKSPDMLTRLAASAPYLVAQSIFMLVLLFFITASGDLFYAKIVEASPTFRDKRRAIGITRDIEKRISRYFLTISVVNAGLGASIGLTLWWLGMPNPLLFGVMAFALNFIPYLGALAGVAVTFAIGIVSFPTLGDALVVAAAYLALTTLEGQLITPYAIGRRLSLNPVIVFIAVAFWGWAWSVIGMFIAVPLLIVALVISERVEGLEGLAIFLSGERLPEPSEEEREAT